MKKGRKKHAVGKTFGSHGLTILRVDGDILPHNNLVHNLGILLSSLLLLKDQVVVMAKGPLYSFILCGSFTCPRLGGSALSHLRFNHLPTGLLCCTLYGPALEE